MRMFEIWSQVNERDADRICRLIDNGGYLPCVRWCGCDLVIYGGSPLEV